MSINPFEEINNRLKNIENYLQVLQTNQKENELLENFSVKQIAEALNVTEQSVRSYIKRGLIPAKKIGRDYVINRKEFENSLKEVKSLKYRRDV